MWGDVSEARAVARHQAVSDRVGRLGATGPSRQRTLRDALLLATAFLSIALIWYSFRPLWDSIGGDSFAYWNVDAADPYAAWYAIPGAFLYSPAAAQVMSVFHLLPWEVFRVVWIIALALVAVRIARWWVLLTPVVLLDLFPGNVHILLAAAIVIGFRHPAAWSVVLLTKVTPGVGLLWFAARREWRSLAIAAGVTAIIATASLLYAPTLWLDWVSHLVGDQARIAYGAIPVPFALRAPIAVIIVVWGARTDRRWTVPIAAMLTLPNLWLGSLAMLIAIVPLVAGRAARQTVPARDAAPTPRLDRALVPE